MPVEGPASTRSAVRYIETIAAFKKAVRTGETSTPAFKKKRKATRRFLRLGEGATKGYKNRRL